jgi:hypothetical protein
LAQLRAEVALLRALTELGNKHSQETETQKKAYAEFLAWVSLTAQEKTQLVANARYGNDQGVLWEVSLKDNPTVRFPAASKFDAIGKYNELCGIISTAHEHAAAPVAAA